MAATTTTATAATKVLYLRCTAPDCTYDTVQKYYRGAGPDPQAIELLSLKDLHELTLDGHKCEVQLRIDKDQDVVEAYTRIKRRFYRQLLVWRLAV